MSTEKAEDLLQTPTSGTTNKDWYDTGFIENGITPGSRWSRFKQGLEKIGVESRGVRPVPVEERQDTQLYKLFFVWFSANCNILSFSAGTLGPVIFRLGIRDSCLTCLFFNVIFCFMPALAATWGPKLGMRQMVISRYSFGYYGVLLCIILNLIGMCGFSILNCILGGQTIASVSNQDLSWTVGIVVIGIVALFVSFCGHTVLHWYERVAWFPVLLTFVIALGLGGRHLGNTAFEPATPQAILSFGATLAGFTITYTPISSDYTTYYRKDAQSWRICLYMFFGLYLPITLLQCTGAAVAASTPSVPLWEGAYTNGNVGGLLEAMLRPVHGFGKFLTILLSLSVIGNLAVTFYSISLNIQLLWGPLIRVPRYIFSTIGTAVVIALAIVGQHKFYDTLVNFLGLLGYWAGAYVSIIFLEHWVFRKGNFELYDPGAWNSPRMLPTGIPALAAVIFAFGPVVPAMDQAWYVGPIAEKTGDIGFEIAFTTSAILYLVFRWIEIQWRGKL